MPFLAVATSRDVQNIIYRLRAAEVTSLTAHSRPHMHETRSLAILCSRCRAPTHPPTAHYYCQARQEVRDSRETIYFRVCVPRPIKENLA
jgi:hypothetical protein